MKQLIASKQFESRGEWRATENITAYINLYLFDKNVFKTKTKVSSNQLEFAPLKIKMAVPWVGQWASSEPSGQSTVPSHHNHRNTHVPLSHGRWAKLHVTAEVELVQLRSSEPSVQSGVPSQRQ